MMEENTQAAPPEHYAVVVENMPPTKIVCKCGFVFTGDDPIADMKIHMQERNES